ncbi:MAG: TIM barrel protein [Anaerolineae bacterium]
MPIRLGNAPVSWGIYEFKDIEAKYLYTRVLDEIRDTGYEGTELGPWGYLPTDPEVLGGELARRGMRLLSAFVPIPFVDPAALDAGEEHAMQVSKLLAALKADSLILTDDNGTVPELIQRAGRRVGSFLNRDQWETYAAGVNRVARKVYDTYGLKVVFHHHCAGYVETPEEVRSLMDRTDHALVGLCLDTGHYEYAGGSSLKAIEEYGERVRYLHFKDCDGGIRKLALDEKIDYFAAVAAGVFCELGKGVVNFSGILRALDRLGYNGWAVVEQDVLTDDLDAPRQSAKRNREYLKTLGV